jgi:2-methylcitrate dehydratase PrpD
MTSSTIESLADWASKLQLDDIPSRVVEKIRLQILTSITAAAFSPWHQPSKTVLKARKSKGEALVFASLDRMSPADAAFVNSAFAMALDFDDYLLTGHTSHSSVLVPLAYAQTLDEVVVAATAANEIMGRLSTNCFIGPLNGQMSSYIHNIGAAIGLGKILNLSPKQMADAMAISLYQPNFCLVPGFWHEGAKTVTASMPIDQGIQAASLAEAGLSGPLDILDHDLGFSSSFSFANYKGIYEGLGKVWFSDTLCYKRYPGTSYISAGVEGALQASKGVPLQPEDIKSVHVETTFLSSTLDQLGAAAINRSPLDANAINFSLRLSIATALLFGDLTPDVLRPEVLIAKEDKLREIAKRITVVHDWKQSIQMISASPTGIAMFAQLRPKQWLRLIKHSKALNRSSGDSPKVRSVFHGIRKDLPKFVRQIRQGRKTQITSLDLDATGFRMIQSARTCLTTKDICKTETVEIPIGACGRDIAETRDLVRWRCTEAFGEKGMTLWEMAFQKESLIESINQVIVDQ